MTASLSWNLIRIETPEAAGVGSSCGLAFYELLIISPRPPPKAPPEPLIAETQNLSAPFSC